MRLTFIKRSTLVLTICFMSFTNAFAQAKVIDKIVAKVGDEIILLSDIQAQRLQLLQEGTEGDQSTDCSILEEFMYEKLLVNQALIDSIVIEETMVNAEMENRIRYIAGQIGSIEKLEDFYGKSVAQIKADFYELIEKRMLAERMKEEITANVKITPREIKQFFNNLPKDSIPYINSKIKVAQIVLYPEVTEKDKLLAKKQLEDVRTDIESGKMRFETGATLYSEDPGSQMNGGDLGWQTRGTMVPQFEAALFKLQPNEISPVFETQYGYHIIKLIERKGDNYKAKHILIIPKVDNKALVQASQKIDSIYNEVNKGTLTFEEAARLYSDDEASKLNGGQIVNPYTNDYLWDIQNINDIDPQMSRIIDQLNEGEFSSPSLYNNMFEQKQGIRIVRLIQRTEPHIANLETDRQLIEMAALNEKKQAAIDKWISTKINGNYIEISPEYSNGCDFKYNWIKGS